MTAKNTMGGERPSDERCAVCGHRRALHGDDGRCCAYHADVRLTCPCGEFIGGSLVLADAVKRGRRAA